MTPKEKAKELVSKMLQYQPYETETINEKACLEFAKQCALIAVDEYINDLNDIDTEQIYLKIVYWQEVKLEIEVL